MRTSLLSKLLLGVAVLAAAQIVVESRAFAQTQLPAIGVRTNSLTLNTSGAIQMANYNGLGELVGGKIVDDSAPGQQLVELPPLSGNFVTAPADAMTRLKNYIQPRITQAAGPGLDWLGTTGFTDPAAAADYFGSGATGIGAVVNGTLIEDGFGGFTAGHTTFAGKAADASSILIAHTYYGDTQLKGYVNMDDYANFSAGLNGNGFDPNGAAVGWAYGDFNGDSVVNMDDYALFSAGLNAGGIGTPIFLDPLGVQVGGWVKSAGVPSVSQASAGSVSAVPEPGTFALLFAFGALVASRAFVLRGKKSVA